MSCDIRKYMKNDQMSVTAFVGPKDKRLAIQFTIDGKYCQLLEPEVFDLVETLLRRLRLCDGYTATGAERPAIEYEG